MRFHSISFLLCFYPPKGGGKNVNRSVEVLAVVAVGSTAKTAPFLTSR